MLYVKSKQIR